MINVAQLRDSLSALPVAAIVDDVVADYMSGKIPVICTATGSGKTLLTPAMIADKLPEGEQLIVLEPRRLIAVNAVSSINDIVGEHCNISDVGYAIGVRGQQASRAAENSRILYMTYGYALSFEAILTGKNFLIDEAHENTIDITICRAILHRRIMAGEDIRVGIMSATMDVADELRYWKNRSVKVHRLENTTFSCDERHVTDTHEYLETIRLINEGHRGILVFLPGKGEINQFENSIKQYMPAELADKVDIVSITGENTYQEQKAALESYDPDRIKVLVGTNILESGINPTWVSAGVSSGTGREVFYTTTSAFRLITAELPQWRLKQQAGRTNRFRDGVFSVVNGTPPENRPDGTTPEILRLPLAMLVMHCAALGINPLELHFQYQPPMVELARAIAHLKALRFVNDDLSLTEDGKFASKLPITVEAAAMLAHAKGLGILREAIIPAVTMSIGSMRKDYKLPHGFDRYSDVIESAIAFCAGDLIQANKTLTGKQRQDALIRHNVGVKRMYDARSLLNIVSKNLKTTADRTPYLEMMGRVMRAAEGATSMTDAELKEFRNKLERCILAGFINNLSERFGTSSYGDTIDGNSLAAASCVCEVPKTTVCAASMPLVIVPKNSDVLDAFTVASNVTLATKSTFLTFAEERPDIFTSKETDDAKIVTYTLPARPERAFYYERKLRPWPHVSTTPMTGPSRGRDSSGSRSKAPAAPQEREAWEGDDVPMDVKLAALKNRFG